MTAQEVRALTTAALADPAVDLAVPVGLSLALREGLPSTVLASLIRGDPAVGDTPGALTYRDGDEIRVASLSPESDLLLSAYLEHCAHKPE
jgi:hypothetical protein